MLKATCDFLETAERLIPNDLLDWFGERTLVQLTLEAVCQANIGSRAGLVGPDLLTLLCYCYARGILGSLEIEQAATHDPTVRRLCGNVCPDWSVIRNFRRRNPDCLLRTLHRLFASVWDLRFGSAPLEPDLRGEGSSTIDSTGQSWLLGLTEAAKRIEQAIRVDSMMMDE